MGEPDVASHPAQRVEVVDRTAPERRQRVALLVERLGQVGMQAYAVPAGQSGGVPHQLRRHGERRAGRQRDLAHRARPGVVVALDHALGVGQDGVLVLHTVVRREPAAGLAQRHAAAGDHEPGPDFGGGLPPDDCVEDEDAILADSQRVIERYHDSRAGSMCQIALAPCSPFSVTPELMRDSAALARRYGVRLHTHLAETLDEERYTLETLGRRPVDYLDSLGWVADDVWFAHAVHVDAAEIRLFADRGTEVCHCPTSNMRLAAGIAPVKD